MAQSPFRLALILALSGSALLSGKLAYAQAKAPELQFYPTQGWDVDSHAGICSVSGTFNNGFIMSLSGSSAWVERFDMNFRQDIFEAGQTYNVRLSVPGATSENVTARAETARILVLNLQGQKNLYQAMRQNAVFDLDVEGNAFRFILTKFPLAADKFERCMAGGDINAPISLENEPVIAAAEAADEVSYTNNESMQLEQEIIASTETNITEIIPEDPQVAIQELSYTQTTKLDDQPIETIDVAQEQSINISPELIANGGGVVAVDMTEQTVIAVPNTPQAASSETAPSQADLQSAEQPPVIAEPEMEQPVAQEPAIKEVVDVPPLEAIEPPQLTPDPVAQASEPQEMDEAPIKKPNAWDSRIIHKETATVEADFSDLEPASARAEKMELVDRISDLERQLGKLRSENQNLNADLKASLKDSRQERISIASNNWNLERATMRFNEAERQIKRLGSQLQRERARCEAETDELEAMLFDPHVTNDHQLAKLADLENQLYKAKRSLDSQRRTYEERIRALEEQLN